MQQRKDNPVEYGIRVSVLGFVLFVWSTLGFILWLAILFRAIVVFSGALFIRVVEGQPTAGADRALDQALHFWIDGFSRIMASRYQAPDETPPSFRFTRFLAESLYSIALVIVSVCAYPLLHRLLQLILAPRPVYDWAVLIAAAIVAALIFMVGAGVAEDAERRERNERIDRLLAKRKPDDSETKFRQ